MFQEGACLSIKLKQKIPKGKSKKIYNGVYVRALDKGKDTHLYDVSSGLYIASIYMVSQEFIYNWIDKNKQLINERVERLNNGRHTTKRSREAPTLF